MSYILDALRRADRERHSLEVPTVHTVQPTGELLPEDEQTASPWVWALGAAGVALLGLAMWAWWSQPPTNLEGLPAPGAGLAPLAVVPAVQTVPPVPPMAALPPQEMPAQAVAALGDSLAPNPPPTRRASTPTEPLALQLRLDTTVQAAKLAPPALPPALRSEWGLSVDGAIYSERKEDRMLIVGGQLFREGEKLRDDLVLEAIAPKSAVIRQKGQRYTVAF
jgi:general secretion pathway protein B